MAARCIVRLDGYRYGQSYVGTTGVEVSGFDVLPMLAKYDFVKMDIEGSEWPILKDERWIDAVQGVTAFVLEWHGRGCTMQNPRLAALGAVKAAGFSFGSGPLGSDHGTIWGWRSAS